MERVTKVGHCRYCHNPIIIEAFPEATEEMLNEEAVELCGCYGAKQMRKKRSQKEACIANIDEMLTEKYPEIAELFKNSIDAIQDAKIKKITINTHFNYTARLSKCKDGIKVEFEKKQKAESLA